MDILNLKAVFTSVTRELDIFLGFYWRDWSASIISGSIFSIGAVRSARLSLPSIISNYLLLVSWLTHYSYFFNLSNQITGVDEDRINKPDRLITSGKDLRDIEGDAAVGQRTMPLVFGDSASRWIITFLLMPAAFWVLWMGDIVPIAPFPLTAIHLFLGYRIMHAGGPHYDYKTYMIYTYIFCLILAFTAGKDLKLEVTEMLQRLAEQTMKSVLAM